MNAARATRTPLDDLTALVIPDCCCTAPTSTHAAVRDPITVVLVDDGTFMDAWLNGPPSRRKTAS